MNLYLVCWLLSYRQTEIRFKKSLFRWLSLCQNEIIILCSHTNTLTHWLSAGRTNVERLANANAINMLRDQIYNDDCDVGYSTTARTKRQRKEKNGKKESDAGCVCPNVMAKRWWTTSNLWECSSSCQLTFIKTIIYRFFKIIYFVMIVNRNENDTRT